MLYLQIKGGQTENSRNKSPKLTSQEVMLNVCLIYVPYFLSRRGTDLVDRKLLKKMFTENNIVRKGCVQIGRGGLVFEGFDTVNVLCFIFS